MPTHKQLHTLVETLRSLTLASILGIDGEDVREEEQLTLASILGIDGEDVREEEQLAEFRVNRGADESFEDANIYHFANFAGIGGDESLDDDRISATVTPEVAPVKQKFADCATEQQPVELRIHRSEDESSNADGNGISSTESPEVVTVKQQFADVAADNEESHVAEKLQKCCDRFGSEKPEMLGQSAACLLKLGELYRNYATNGEGIQQKLNFIKSAVLIVGAMVRYQQLQNDEGLETSKCEIRKLQDEIQMLASLGKRFNVFEISQDLKRALEACRVEVLERFDDIFRVHEKSEGKVRRERLEEAYEVSTKHYLDIIKKTAEECQDIMGNPPCKFAIIGLGSLARKETTLYSDFQHAIILEDDITESPSFDETMEYFRWYTTIFQMIIIGFGETAITNVDVKSLNDLYADDQPKKWFSDEYTPCGISFDSMMPSACKIPLGRQEPTKRRRHTIELIQPVSQMVNLMTREQDIRNGCHLSEILGKTIFVYGNREVHNRYLEESDCMRSQQTLETFLEQQFERLLSPNITARHPWFHYAVQERLTSLLSCLANLFQLQSRSGFEIVHDLLDNDAIDYYMYHELMDAVAVGMEIKMKIHHLLSHKARNFSHVQVIKLVEEERFVTCYKILMQYTILTQKQLFALPRSVGISSMQLFLDEAYWGENEFTMARSSGIQVIWKEVEFGLGQTCEAIEKCDKYAENSSAEAKFVMRMVSVATSTLFDCAFFSRDLLVWCAGILSAPFDTLESHCRFFLQFLQNNIQAQMHYNKVMCLIHYNQKNFQQAYEDFELYQELYYRHRSQSIYGSKQWMYLEFLHVRIISGVKLTDDMLECIQHQVATKANYPRRWVLTTQYCVALLKMGKKEEAKKNILMLAKRVGSKGRVLEIFLEDILNDDSLGAAVIPTILISMLHGTTSELSKFLSKDNISGVKQGSIQRRLASDIRLGSTKARTLQYVYNTTSLFQALSLAADCFVSDRRKSAHLLWKILHSPSVTRPIMLDSVLVLFRHLWHGLVLFFRRLWYGLSFQQVAVDAKIMDIDIKQALSLAADCFVSERRKSAHLLWKILHSPSVTKPMMVLAAYCSASHRRSAHLLWKIIHSPSVTRPMMLVSVLLLFRHLWHRLSLQPVAAADDKIMDIDVSGGTIPQEHETVTVPLLDVLSTSLHQLQEERQLTSNNGTISASNMQGDEGNIVASESKNALISKEGGKIDVGGCTVNFRRESFDNVSKVHAKSEIDSSKWPSKYICITAMLWVHSERNLLKRASVAMKSWCMKNRTDSREVEVHLLHLKKGSTTWDVVARLPLNDLKVFHFDCTDFSPYVFGVHEDDLAATDHVVEGHIYAGRRNNFSLAFFLQHELIFKFVEDMMAKRSSELELNFSPILVQPNDKISANLKCTEETFRFPNDFKNSFKIDDKFVRLKKAFFHSSLIGNSNDSKYVLFECQVQQNDTIADGPHYFNYEWKPNQSASQRQQPGVRRIITEIQGAGPIGDLHIFGTGNTHDNRQYPNPASTERDNDAADQS